MVSVPVRLCWPEGPSWGPEVDAWSAAHGAARPGVCSTSCVLRDWRVVLCANLAGRGSSVTMSSRLWSASQNE